MQGHELCIIEISEHTARISEMSEDRPRACPRSVLGGLESVSYVSSKKKFTWRRYVGYYDTDLNTAFRCDEVQWHARISAKSLDGNSRAPYLNWNGSNRNLNANNASNEWNDRNRFLFVRNFISFPVRLSHGVFFFLLCDDLIVPPTKHFSYFNKLFCECKILFGMHNMRLLCDTK